MDNKLFLAAGAFFFTTILGGCGGSGGSSAGKPNFTVVKLPVTYRGVLIDSSGNAYLENGNRTYLYNGSSNTTVSKELAVAINPSDTLVTYPHDSITHLTILAKSGGTQTIPVPQVSSAYPAQSDYAVLTSFGNFCVNFEYAEGPLTTHTFYSLNGTHVLAPFGQHWDAFVGTNELIGAVGSAVIVGGEYQYQNMKPYTTTDGVTFTPVALPNGYDISYDGHNFFAVSSDYKQIYGNLVTNTGGFAQYFVCKWTNGLANPPTIITGLNGGLQVLYVNTSGDAVVAGAAHSANGYSENQTFFFLNGAVYDQTQVVSSSFDIGSPISLSDHGVLLCANAILKPTGP